jgi:transposase
LKSLARRLEHGRKPAKMSQVQQQIGRMLQRNQRSAKLFDIRCEVSSLNPSGLSVIWSRKREEENWAALSEGCYVLRTNIRDWKEENVWNVYIQLTQAEAAFRIHKDELDIRPIWHQKKERARAHILVCFLAYVLWKMLEQWQSRVGLGHSPRTILEELGQIRSGDVVLPTTSGELIRLRCVVRPEKAQAIILQRLGVEIPRRVRIPPGVAKM